MALNGLRLDRCIEYGLWLAFLTALVSSFLIRTPHLPSGAPPLTLHPRPVPAGIPFAGVDAIDHGGTRSDPRDRPIHVRASDDVTVIGWAVDPATEAPPASINARIDDGRPVAGSFVNARPDIVATLANRNAIESGYAITLHAGSRGRHVLRVLLLSRGRMIPAYPPIELDVSP